MLRTLLRWICNLLFRVRISGNTDALQPGKLLIIANHESFLDGVLLGLYLPLQPTFVVHTTVLENPLFAMLLKRVPHLAVDPTSPMAMKKVIALLEANQPVVIFPEGRITLTGSLMKVYDGPAFVAAKTGAPLVPVRLDGPARSYFSRLSGQHPRRLLPRITISVLPTRHLPMPDAPTAKARRRLAAEAMRKLMQEMIFASRPSQTLFTALLDAAQIHGRRARVLEDVRQQEETYGQILRNTLAMGRLLEKFTAAGEAVGVLLPNVSNTVSVIFGLAAFGRVPAMLNYTAGADGINSACHAANVRTLISSRKFIETAKLQAVIDPLAGHLRIIYLEDLRTQFTLQDRLWLIAALCAPRRFTSAAQIHPHAAAVILFTSGSEGKPKAVLLSHNALLANIAQVRAVIDFSASDKFMVCLPVFHAFGLTAGVIMPLVTGCRLFLYPSPLHYRLIPEVIYDRGCTVLFGTSTFLSAYAKFAHPYDFYRLRYVVSGAEKLQDDVRKTWIEKFGIRILEGYGATECAPVIAVNTPMAYRSGTVGTLLPGMAFQLEPVNGIARGGVLHVRGPNIMLGYYLYASPAKLQAPQSSFGDGWYNTGDVVEIDSEGFISIKGRVKRFAKIAGEMISLETAEKLAAFAAPDCQHAVVAIADAKRGEALLLFTTSSTLAREGLLHAARQQGAAELAIAKQIVHVQELPVLGTGKIDYVSLKQQADQLTTPASGSTANDHEPE